MISANLAIESRHDRSGPVVMRTQRALLLPCAVALALLLTAVDSVTAQQPPCRPCVGVRAADPAVVLEALRTEPRLEEDSRLYVVWGLAADETADATISSQITEAGGAPWVVVRFSTPAPLLQNLERLEVELAALARIAGQTGELGHVQIDWQPDGAAGFTRTASDYAFLIKRTAVTVTGANPDARVIIGPLDADAVFLRDIYAEDVAAYVDGVAFAPAADERIAAAIEMLAQLDPGRPAVLDSLELPEPASLALARAADATENGIGVTLFRAAPESDLTPLKLLAREFSGDLSLDPYSVPVGGVEAWSFVRGEDLSLQVLVEIEPGVEEIALEFTEAQLRDPRRVLASGEEIPLFGGRRTQKGFELTVADPDRVLLLKLNRLTAAEIEGIAGLDESVTVESSRTMPVAEILRRHQAFQDSQQRRLRTYRAENTLSLRLQAGGGAQGFDITFQGDFFFTQGEGFDWAWQRFFVNGVSWRNQRVPQIPLLQPEKASAAPAEITFTKDYSYRLRGTQVVDGRDCWVVDFEPAVAVTPDKSLYQGTVWIDREIYARVKSRTVQLGLRGDAVSNDETIFFSPVDTDGEPAPWSTDSYFLPLRTIGQQIYSILNAALVVERERTLADISINSPDFDERRDTVLASDATMLRDTEVGMRYLVLDKETGERQVQETPDPTRLFLLGGVFYDEALDFPLPLGGVNWLSFDFKGTGGQANVFFAGLLVLADIATPSLFGSRWEAGADLFVLGLAGTDTLYVEGEEINDQDVETMRPNVDFTLGRNIGNYFKVQFEYSLGWHTFDDASSTSPDFVIPSDHLDHDLQLRLSYNRNGYRLRLGGGYRLRDEWEPWGFEDNPDYDPDKDVFLTYGAGIAKTWFLRNFIQLGAEIEYVGGEDLDRFSKFQFGPFSDVVVRGYRSELIRAEEAWVTHLNYGFNLGEIFQLKVLGDAAWATDEATRLDREFLAGIGVSGTFVGPWRTIVNLEVGKAVAGPDDGFTALIAFLKLFS